MLKHDLLSDDGKHLASVMPANNKDVLHVLSSPEKTGDGRSEFVWVRLLNGDLLLGVFPQGDTYIEVSDPLDI